MTGNIAMDPYFQDIIEKAPQACVEIGRECPVYHYQGPVFDFHIVSDTVVVREMLHDHQRWPYGLGSGPKEAGAQANVGIMTDPPCHNEVRHIIRRAMSPKPLPSRLIVRPDGIPEAQHFDIVEEAVSAPGEGQILVGNHFLSVEPAMRGWGHESSAPCSPDARR